jgi:hypothetical protein
MHLPPLAQTFLHSDLGAETLTLNTMIPPDALHTFFMLVVKPLASHCASVVAQPLAIHGASVVANSLASPHGASVVLHLWNPVIHLKWKSIVTNMMRSLSLTPEKINKMFESWVKSFFFKQGMLMRVNDGKCIITKDGHVLERSRVEHLMLNALNDVAAEDFAILMP